MKYFLTLFLTCFLLVYVVGLWDYLKQMNTNEHGLRGVVMCVWGGEETCKAILEKPDENL